MNTIPTLSTPRFRLRAFTQADLDAYAAMCADEEVMRHIGNGGAVARDGAWRHLAMFLGQTLVFRHPARMGGASGDASGGSSGGASGA